ncbi:uncharacterized protein FIBRA_08130 [Fibroporia radiculosa]|uniref:Uncharacterized protein n=1 Tax=Fibroporia radiculosa TaxID=599839 RepID=J4I285_9APHY|nr:uncharacterized protein FIBRA_08130 [Fibroporia radiculosa]CCM05892.1 predicted protein [Fibroporia radiculosa]
MRVKISSAPPLPVCKAWFSVYSASTVLELKLLLCSDLPALRDARLDAKDLVLVLEEFELLDSSPIDVVRDGDLIVIKRNSLVPSNKRKAPTSDHSPARKRTKHVADELRSKTLLSSTATHEKPRPYVQRGSSPSSSSSSNSESESNTSNSSDTTSESDSGSDSNSETSSSASSASSSPSVEATQPAQSKEKTCSVLGSVTAAQSLAFSRDSRASVTATVFVPPGLGKPSTHSRNVRRRRKRMYERLAATAEPVSVNEIPLGLRTRIPESAPPQQIPLVMSAPKPSIEATQEPPVIMMASLQNKNKRKGFKKSMSSVIPPKIIFDVEDDAAGPSHSTISAEQALPFSSVDTIDQDVYLANARLIPPSEKQERGLLPAHMFVTSVDVEEGLHPKRNKRKKRARLQDPEEVADDDYQLPYDDMEYGQIAPEPTERLRARSVPTHESSALDRAAVNAKWVSLVKLSVPSQLKPDIVVAWKELGINPTTFTPEMLLHLGRVVSCAEQLVVKPILEHSPAEISFGGLIVAEDEEVDHVEMEQAYLWSDVTQGDWRIVP